MPLVTKAIRQMRQRRNQGETFRQHRQLSVTLVEKSKRKDSPAKATRQLAATTSNHERKFVLAFNALLGKLLTDDMLATLAREVAAKKKPDAILRSIPFFDEDDPRTFATWQRFARTMEATYTDVINETIVAENRKRGWSVETLKAKTKRANVLPLNPRVAEWMRVASLTRVVDMSKKEKERIRTILVDGMKAGAHPTALVDEIRDTVGLTDFQTQRLGRKVAAARDEGMSASSARAYRRSEAAKVRLQRARAISRTETNDALTRALTETWASASERGLMPKGTRKKWASMPFEEKRSSEVCEDLDGQEVGIDEDFQSSAGEGFSGHGPPAHPNCRSTLILIFPE